MRRVSIAPGLLLVFLGAVIVGVNVNKTYETLLVNKIYKNIFKRNSPGPKGRPFNALSPPPLPAAC